MASEVNEQATLEEIIGWLKNEPRDRKLGRVYNPEYRSYCRNCVIAAYLGRDGQWSYVGREMAAVGPSSEENTQRPLGDDEFWLRETYDIILAERNTDHITVGDFLDELADVGNVTSNTRLMEALA